jgi:hypothetical protein
MTRKASVHRPPTGAAARWPKHFLVAALAALAACGESATTPARSLAPVASMDANLGNSLNAHLCQKDGWQGLVTSTGAPFASQDACVSYGAEGGTLFKAQTITFGALAGKTFGNADFTVSATASSGLPVTFTAAGSCTVAGSTVHITGGGSCTITAHQAGDATWFAAPDVAQSFTIAKASQTVSFKSTNPSPATVGATYTPTATATSGLPVAITLAATSAGCSLTSGVVSFTSPGTCLLNANQAGNTNWLAAPQVQQSISVVGIPVTPTLSVTNAISKTNLAWGIVSGAGLKPGTTVILCNDFNGCLTPIPGFFDVDADGTLGSHADFGVWSLCQTNFFAKALRPDGTTITSNKVNFPAGYPGCP